jgi:hypothetical protein
LRKYLLFRPGAQMLGIAPPRGCRSSATRTIGVFVATKHSFRSTGCEAAAPARRRPSAFLLSTLALLACYGLFNSAAAQTCTVSGSGTVTLTTGSCAIAPNTTLNGSPAVHATTSAQIATNNVTINPFNDGSIGGLAGSNGTITFGSGSSINGNWATAASAQTGGQIIFQSRSAINPPFGGGVTALLADGVGPGGQPSHIIATGLAVNMNGTGGNVAGKATGGGIITLNSGTVINFAAGSGGNTGLWATGAGSQIVAIGTNLNMIGGGGGDIGVRADTGANVTLIGGAAAKPDSWRAAPAAASTRPVSP